MQFDDTALKLSLASGVLVLVLVAFALFFPLGHVNPLAAYMAICFTFVGVLSFGIHLRRVYKKNKNAYFVNRPWNTSNKTCGISYDVHQDVMVFSKEYDPVSSQTRAGYRGIQLHYSVFDLKPTGVSIIGYDEEDWPSRKQLLASIVARHLNLRVLDALACINSCTKMLQSG